MARLRDGLLARLFTRGRCQAEGCAMRNEDALEPALKEKLRRLRLQPELAGNDSVRIRGVPVNSRLFSKSRTNLLVKKSDGATPAIVAVDEDLLYTGGDDRPVARAFSAAAKLNGWRVLVTDNFGGRDGNLSAGVEYALELLGTAEPAREEEHEQQPAGSPLLSAWGQNITSAVASGRTHGTLFREEQVEQAAAATMTQERRLVLVVGPPGVGKTNLLAGVAQALKGSRVVAVNAGALLSGTHSEGERENLMLELFREVAADRKLVLALEGVEYLFMASARAAALVRDGLDRGARLMATSAVRLEQFEMNAIAGRVETVRLGALSRGEAQAVLEQRRATLAEFHGVAIDEEAESAAARRGNDLAGHLPAKALHLLEAAAARAQLSGEPRVTELDVLIAASRIQEGEEAQG